jgi:hypothetical protein
MGRGWVETLLIASVKDGDGGEDGEERRKGGVQNFEWRV